MTYDNDTGSIDVGKCPYTVFEQRHPSLQPNGYIELPANLSKLNEFMCGPWNREGFLCSKCKSGHGLVIPNVFMNCIKCKFEHGEGWFFYIMLQLIPVIFLFLIILVLRVSVVKPPLNAYVVFCQVSLVLLFTNSHRFSPPYVNDNPKLEQAHYLSMLSVGIWSMTFTGLIRGVGLTDFCVDPDVNIQQAFILTQIKSLFPLALIACTYMCIKLYNRKFVWMVYLCKPFHKCLTCCTERWNPQKSLVDVFATFLLLSYSRFIIVLYFTYSFQHTYQAPSSRTSLRLLFNPAVKYFDHVDHLPYALILLVILLMVVVPPVFLLLLYQAKCFQKILSLFHFRRILSIYIFVDLFQSCYRNGLNGGYDLRFTASLYLLLRIALLLTYVGCNNSSFEGCGTLLTFIWVILLLLFFALLRPYKDQRMNVLDSLLLAGLALINILLCSTAHYVENKTLQLFVLILVLVIIASPHLALIAYVFKLLVKSKCMERLLERMKVLSITASRLELSDILPDRVDNPYRHCNDS